MTLFDLADLRMFSEHRFELMDQRGRYRLLLAFHHDADSSASTLRFLVCGPQRGQSAPIDADTADALPREFDGAMAVVAESLHADGFLRAVFGDPTFLPSALRARMEQLSGQPPLMRGWCGMTPPDLGTISINWLTSRLCAPAWYSLAAHPTKFAVLRDGHDPVVIDRGPAHWDTAVADRLPDFPISDPGLIEQEWDFQAVPRSIRAAKEAFPASDPAQPVATASPAPLPADATAACPPESPSDADLPAADLPAADLPAADLPAAVTPATTKRASKPRRTGRRASAPPQESAPSQEPAPPRIEPKPPASSYLSLDDVAERIASLPPADPKPRPILASTAVVEHLTPDEIVDALAALVSAPAEPAAIADAVPSPVADETPVPSPRSEEPPVEIAPAADEAAAPLAEQEAATPVRKRRGRPPGSRNKPKIPAPPAPEPVAPESASTTEPVSTGVPKPVRSVKPGDPEAVAETPATEPPAPVAEAVSSVVQMKRHTSGAPMRPRRTSRRTTSQEPPARDLFSDNDPIPFAAPPGFTRTPQSEAPRQSCEIVDLATGRPKTLAATPAKKPILSTAESLGKDRAPSPGSKAPSKGAGSTRKRVSRAQAVEAKMNRLWYAGGIIERLGLNDLNPDKMSTEEVQDLIKDKQEAFVASRSSCAVQPAMRFPDIRHDAPLSEVLKHYRSAIDDAGGDRINGERHAETLAAGIEVESLLKDPDTLRAQIWDNAKRALPAALPIVIALQYMENDTTFDLVWSAIQTAAPGQGAGADGNEPLFTLGQLASFPRIQERDGTERLYGFGNDRQRSSRLVAGARWRILVAERAFNAVMSVLVSRFAPVGGSTVSIGFAHHPEEPLRVDRTAWRLVCLPSRILATAKNAIHEQYLRDPATIREHNGMDIALATSEIKHAVSKAAPTLPANASLDKMIETALATWPRTAMEADLLEGIWRSEIANVAPPKSLAWLRHVHSVVLSQREPVDL